MRVIYGQPKGKSEIVINKKRITINLFFVDYEKDGRKIKQYRAIHMGERATIARRGDTIKSAVSNLFLDVDTNEKSPNMVGT